LCAIPGGSGHSASGCRSRWAISATRELLMGPTAFATWDEVELLEVSSTSPGGAADAQRLGVTAAPMRIVLGNRQG
jgi:hypothetical protein